MHVIEPTWTDERVEQLRKLHAEGLAFSLIGVQLGISRNACIGKAQRLGLDPRPHFDNTPVRRLSPQEQAARAERIRVQKLQAQRRHRAIVAHRPAPKPAPAPAPVALECRPCSLLELTKDTCRFPIGDPGEADFHFCGASPWDGDPYCGFHARLAYLPKTRGDRSTWRAV